ncbi:MAG: Rrf2 family transcriptional regulator [Chloroflexi bacterium]|nr:Rrf2 family transcriptional regulator [Chloroflexota bacterium]
MNLSLTKTGDYVVRAALSLALMHPRAGYLKIREVAAQMDLPIRYTPQILRMLAKAGLAESRAGRDGGYRLTRDPADISLLQVVEAGEGELYVGRCTISRGLCHLADICALHTTLEDAMLAFRETLEAASLADVATGAPLLAN